jgi:hypothetical protein
VRRRSGMERCGHRLVIFMRDVQQLKNITHERRS